jgi:hypothetical protein
LEKQCRSFGIKGEYSVAIVFLLGHALANCVAAPVRGCDGLGFAFCLRYIGNMY